MSAILIGQPNLKPTRLRVSNLLTLVALVLAFSSTAWAQGPKGEAAAAPAPAPTRALYQAYLAADCGASSNFCRFTSEVVPAKGLLEIHRVACQGWHENAVPPTYTVIVELRTGADAYVGRIDFLKTTYMSTTWGNVWAIGEQTAMVIPAGHKLRVSLNSGSTGVGSYGCTIAGYLTTS